MGPFGYTSPQLGCSVIAAPSSYPQTLIGVSMNPQAHIRSLPPKGAHASFEAARQEA